MDNSILVIVGVMSGGMLLLMLGSVAMYAKCYRRIPPDKALVVMSPQGMIVAMQGGFLVYPIVNHAETIDLSFRAVRIEAPRLTTRDDVCVDVTATFRFRVNATEDDVKKVATTIGCARATDETTLRELFEARCKSALKEAVRDLPYRDLPELEGRALEKLGSDLGGYVVDGVGIEPIKKSG